MDFQHTFKESLFDSHPGRLSVSLAQYYREHQKFCNMAASLTGQQLAVCHQLLTSNIRFMSNDLMARDAKVPTFDPYKLDTASSFSPAQQEMNDLIVNNNEMCQALESLQDMWTVNGFIHSDLRLENCMLQLESSSNSKPKNVTFLDWESFQTGDVAWDIAGVMAGFLSILSLGNVNDSYTGKELNNSAVTYRKKSEHITQQMRSFCLSYLQQGKIGSLHVKTLLNRVINFSAARLLSLSLDSLSGKEEMTLDGLLHLQLAQNILEDPEKSRKTLLAGDGQPMPSTRSDVCC
ncbi:hypothetical protein CS022_11895 [Veronia nyctiphanis]|uniref:Uncharacterized protein n=1 Tax=Veronia nyctiphanis TaxID=1278244 RepID=A0A4Q0YPM8_9GAMM|nr:phosphotransferase [Veronia nyctiphanis]RXJ73000.1 hypothetical protein CS022_11895 [Veronia nyctiphanis]